MLRRRVAHLVRQSRVASRSRVPPSPTSCQQLTERRFCAVPWPVAVRRCGRARSPRDVQSGAREQSCGGVGAETRTTPTKSSLLLPSPSRVAEHRVEPNEAGPARPRGPTQARDRLPTADCESSHPIGRRTSQRETRSRTEPAWQREPADCQEEREYLSLMGNYFYLNLDKRRWCDTTGTFAKSTNFVSKYNEHKTHTDRRAR